MNDMSININQPLVSICCITYNQEKYIRDALVGFLMQETTFPFEIIIHDDASVDRTANIIQEYEKKYPALITAIYQSENQYSSGVRGIAARFTFPKVRGKYIALCEGDDYWTDPYKLQKQVDIMESDPTISFCFHSVKLLIEDDGLLKEKVIRRSYNNRVFSIKEIILGGGSLCPTQSIMFKKEAILDLPAWYYDAPVGDYFLNVWVASKGKVYYLKDTMAVYRANAIGSWSSSIMLKGAFRKRLEHCKAMIEFIKKLDQSTDYNYSKWFKVFIRGIIKAILQDEYDSEFKYSEYKSYLSKLSYFERIHMFISIKIPLWEKISRNIRERISYYFHFSRIL